MSFNKSPLAFDDAREILERALNSTKGIRIPCTSRGTAIVLRARLNYFRKLDRGENTKIYEASHPLWKKSVYDKLMLRIPAKGEPDENILYIEPYSMGSRIISIEDIS